MTSTFRDLLHPQVKHLRSTSSQPGCYTGLYFYSLTTYDVFPSIFPVVKKCSSFPFLITWPRTSACLLLSLLISFIVGLLRLLYLEFLNWFSFLSTILWAVFSRTKFRLLLWTLMFVLSLTMVHIRSMGSM